jgi:hypothetical protein
LRCVPGFSNDWEVQLTMPIEAKCSSCGYVFRRPDGMLGKLDKCPECHQVVEMPTVVLRPQPVLARGSPPEDAGSSRRKHFEQSAAESPAAPLPSCSIALASLPHKRSLIRRCAIAAAVGVPVILVVALAAFFTFSPPLASRDTDSHTASMLPVGFEGHSKQTIDRRVPLPIPEDSLAAGLPANDEAVGTDSPGTSPQSVPLP